MTGSGSLRVHHPSLHYSCVKLSLKLTARLRRWPWEKVPPDWTSLPPNWSNLKKWTMQLHVLITDKVHCPILLMFLCRQIFSFHRRGFMVIVLALDPIFHASLSQQIIWWFLDIKWRHSGVLARESWCSGSQKYRASGGQVGGSLGWVKKSVGRTWWTTKSAGRQT